MIYYRKKIPAAAKIYIFILLYYLYDFVDITHSVFKYYIFYTTSVIKALKT